MNTVCKKCSGINLRKWGTTRNGSIKLFQKWVCKDCGYSFNTELLKFNAKVSEKLRIKQRYFERNIYNIGYVDIETDGQLKGDFGQIITCCILIRNIKTEKTRLYKFRVTKEEILTKYNYDRRIIKELFEKMKECDLVVGHWFNGWKKFDMPFLRVRCEELKIKIPTYHTLKYADTWNMAHSVLNLQSYSLGGVARGLGLKDIKTKFDPRTWKLSRRGNTKALLKVLDHNVKDVILTYRIHKRLEKYVNISSSYI